MRFAVGFVLGAVIVGLICELRPRTAVMIADGYVVKIEGDKVKTLWTPPEKRILPMPYIAPGIDTSQ